MTLERGAAGEFLRAYVRARNPKPSTCLKTDETLTAQVQ
jgi:hypothetical protein